MGFMAFFLFASFVYTCIHILNHTVRRRATKLPPGPVPLPIIGSLLRLGKQPHKSLTKLANLYGPLMALKLGSVMTIVVSSSNAAKEILQKNDQAFANRTVIDAVRVNRFPEFSLVWLPICPRWRTLRKICNSQIFTSQRLDENQGVRHQKVEDLLNYVNNCCKSSSAVDIGRVAFVTSLNLLSNTVFSVDLVDLNSEHGQEFKAIVWGILEEAGKPNVSDYFPLLRRLDLLGIRRRFGNYFAKLDELFDQMISKRLQNRESGKSAVCNDFLDTLLDHSEENGSEAGYPDIKSILKDIFVAGTDTTSTTVEWAMSELLHNPKLMAKARSELNQVMDKHKAIAESDITRFPYLQAIVKETFRLHPPVPLLIPHRNEADVKIGDLVVPKQSQVLVNAWAIGRDPATWENPSTFMPERFLGSEIDYRGRDFELIPFGAGRRICPGLPLAHRMVHLMLASLIHSFDWKLEDGIHPEKMDMQEKFGITLQKAKPLRVIPIEL